MAAPAPFVPPVEHLPQMRNPETDTMLTTISGQLVVRNGCLTIARGSQVYVVIWPSAARLEAAGDTPGNFLIVPEGLSGPGELRIGLDVNVKLDGGGSERSAALTPLMRDPLPDRCAGPIWRAQEIELAPN